ncbi:MAG: ABC transporter permease [Patescibacteria group bacterium]
MNLKYTLISAFNSILAHKMRSFLTVLGILIGVASIISVMSIGQGATDLIVSEIDQMGASTVVVFPSTDGGVDMMESFYADLLTERDLRAVRRSANVPDVEEVMPVVTVPGDIRHYDEVYRGAMIMGASAEFFGKTFNVSPHRGADFNEFDINSQSRVAVIGSRVKEELFDRSDAVGESVMIGGTRFRVMGVYPPIGQRGMFNIDDIVVVPYSTAQTYILGSNEFERFIVRANDPSNVDRVAFDITAILRETRNVGDNEDDNFTVMTQQSLRDQIGNVMGILTGFIAFIVSIALLVGGIGIMNIMLVSVTERTREIGLRKALGATRKAILGQFLWEAIILTLWGGILGIFFGSMISFSVSLFLSNFLDLDWVFSFPYEAAALGVGVSALVGLVFGLYPAKKAADLSPVEALQYE